MKAYNAFRTQVENIKTVGDIVKYIENKVEE